MSTIIVGVYNIWGLEHEIDALKMAAMMDGCWAALQHHTTVKRSKENPELFVLGLANVEPASDWKRIRTLALKMGGKKIWSGDQ